MKNFYLERDGLVEGECVIFSNGSVAVMRDGSHAIYESIQSVARISFDIKIVFENDEQLESPMLFEIGKAENGWMIREIYSQKTIVGAEDCDSEAESFKNLLWSFMNHFGPSCSRYDSERIIICCVPGDKCEHANFSLEKVRSQITDHIEYALRFFENLRETDKNKKIEKMIQNLEKIHNYFYPSFDQKKFIMLE